MSQATLFHTAHAHACVSGNSSEPGLLCAGNTERWPAIVAGIRKLADAYAGASRIVLSIVEQSGQPTVSVAAGAEGTPSLAAALVGTLIAPRPVTPAASDTPRKFDFAPIGMTHATAAYLLQNEIQRL